MFEYQCKIVRVIDGDTVVVNIDLGFRIRVEHSVRLAGINAPEKNTIEGKEAAKFLSILLPVGAVVAMKTEKPYPADKYGRWVADISLNGFDDTASEMMVDAGKAVFWDGRGVRP